METLYIWPDMPGLSLAVLVIASMFFLYMAREPMHRALQDLAGGTAGGLKNIAEWAQTLSNQMREKNRKVLLESGIAEVEQKIHEEFRRVEANYTKHLSDYPRLHLKMDESIARIDNDYKECGQATLDAPGWNEAVKSIADLQGSSGDRVIEKVLGEIHKSAISGEKNAVAELRSTSARRHRILNSMAPVWKRLSKLTQEVGSKVENLLETTARVDRYIAQYEKIKQGGEESIDMLSSQTTKLFVFSLIVIVIAIFGAFINFQLIALPMSELVPAGTRLLGMPVSDVSAMVIVLLEIVLGIFLMESLGITSIFPQIATMTRNKRRVLFLVSMLGLFFLAFVEASLAILRETIAATESIVQQELAGRVGNEGESGNSSVALIGQATLGFALPWILALVAIPLEMFIEASQHVVAKIWVLIVTLFGKISRILSYILEYFIKIVIHLYDAYIILPQKLGELITAKRMTKSTAKTT